MHCVHPPQSPQWWLGYSDAYERSTNGVAECLANGIHFHLRAGITRQPQPWKTTRTTRTTKEAMQRQLLRGCLYVAIGYMSLNCSRGATWIWTALCVKCVIYEREGRGRQTDARVATVTVILRRTPACRALAVFFGERAFPP